MDDGRLFRYNLFDLSLAMPAAAANVVSAGFVGRPAFTALECVRQLRVLLVGSLGGTASICFLYGLIVSFYAVSRLPAPESYSVLILPHLGGPFTEFIVPFAIANLVGIKSVVAIVSDVAAMRLSGEVEVLVILGLDPARSVFAPRALALLVVSPCLAVFGVFAGALGCWAGTRLHLDLPLASFWMEYRDSLSPARLGVMLLKISLVAFVLGLVAGREAFRPAGASGRPQVAIGRLATAASGVATLAITVVNLFFHLLDAWREGALW